MSEEKFSSPADELQVDSSPSLTCHVVVGEKFFSCYAAQDLKLGKFIYLQKSATTLQMFSIHGSEVSGYSSWHKYSVEHILAF